jgi:hypothetical protein
MRIRITTERKNTALVPVHQYSMASHLGKGVEEVLESRNELWAVLLPGKAQGGHSLQPGGK